MRVLRNSALVFAVSAAAFALAGPALAVDEITFGTNWVAEAEHGGFYQAAIDGTYEKYGLKVNIIAKADQAMLLGGKIQFYMQGNLLGTFSAVEQDVPVIEVAAMFQKDPQIIMAHPEAGLKEFGDLAKLKSLFIADDLYVTGYQWMKAAYPGITDEQRKPYNYSVAPFLADKESGQQGYLTSEPFAVMKEGGFEPTVFLMADAGYTTYSTMIEGMADYVAANPDLTKRFVEASIIGWYNYLYGDNKAANDWIKKDNPDMTRRADRLHDLADEEVWPAGLRRGGSRRHRLLLRRRREGLLRQDGRRGGREGRARSVEGLHDRVRLQGRRQGACEVGLASRRRVGGRDRRRSAPVPPGGHQ